MDIKRIARLTTIAGSAALLFMIQPIIAKALLPRFGGSAGVWVTCMMFFQVVLLLGYLYSFWITRYPSPRVRTAVHLCLVAVSLLVLPLRPPVEWASGNPTLSVLLALASSVGLPFFLLSTTNSLVQSWYAGARGAHLPYRLFALSNTACLLALLAYPVAVEPALAVSAQLRWWSAGYLVLALLIAIGAIDNRAWTFADEPGPRPSRDTRPAAPSNRPFLWIALAACASALWLSVANYLSQEVAAIPFLWVLPLALYLLSFILCFESEGWYAPALFRWLLPAAWIGIGLRIGLAGGVGDLRLDIAVMLAALLVLCLFCHGELARTKPAARQGLAFFYLMAATGGALGGIFVGLIAPAVFSTYLELPVGVVASVFLALVLIYGVTSWARLVRMGVLPIAALVAVSSFHGGTDNVAISRNFYGTLEIGDTGEGDLAVRTLYNGRTVHGVQFLAPARRDIPTGYYGTQSGIGLLLDASGIRNRRVAIVGLGAGTLAAYGRKGDLFRFYEINPAVVQAASAHFYFLADSAAATEVVTGDGRLRLEQEAPHSFDLIVLDAFSDDAIPVHLLTREAFRVYFARLRGGAPLAIHLTNRYLNLNPVVESLAGSLQKRVLRIHSAADPERQTIEADWAVVSDWNETARKLWPYADPAPSKHGSLWTDQYSNLFQVWK
jgi:spermidine synthase